MRYDQGYDEKEHEAEYIPGGEFSDGPLPESEVSEHRGENTARLTPSDRRMSSMSPSSSNSTPFIQTVQVSSAHFFSPMQSIR